MSQPNPPAPRHVHRRRITTSRARHQRRRDLDSISQTASLPVPLNLPILPVRIIAEIAAEHPDAPDFADYQNGEGTEPEHIEQVRLQEVAYVTEPRDDEGVEESGPRE
ncbi:hypothetical protein PVAG01_04703 [Phlyctema vagabunda]|uniref:Uncharacterized protein n=1 Tax=Phlyctema vagabunda TaxID=108571 RepID=A0ABR4PHY9_9HELO